MQIPFEEIETLKATSSRDIYKVNFENLVDYKKVKYVLSRLPIRWSANDFTKTIYFLGLKLFKE